MKQPGHTRTPRVSGPFERFLSTHSWSKLSSFSEYKRSSASLTEQESESSDKSSSENGFIANFFRWIFASMDPFDFLDRPPEDLSDDESYSSSASEDNLEQVENTSSAPISFTTLGYEQ